MVIDGRSRKWFLTLWFAGLLVCLNAGCPAAAPRAGSDSNQNSADTPDLPSGTAEDEPTEPPDTTDTTDVAPKVLVSIVSHVEEDPDYENNPLLFEQHRAALLAFAELLHQAGVSFNWQSDWNFLKAVARYDSRPAETNGKNIAQYMKEDLGFEVDPHAHERLYNYADVAYLLELLGVAPSGIVGGFIVDPPSESILEQFWAPITGEQYAFYTWQAQTLWGGGTGRHVDEEGLWTSGIWRPADRERFLEHDPDAPLPNIGNFGGTWENLDLLLALREAGQLTDGIHTCTIMIGQRDIVQPTAATEFQAELEARQDHPGIRWVGLAEVMQIWQEEYGGEVNTLSYDEAQAMMP